ncbi:MAG: Gfo/Idh/MocA family oxidoreductase [Chloroflexi bacterium]|nr:Gfo/Idh/MocA family oxidoreductase [Chloroflexota bacterium]
MILIAGLGSIGRRHLRNLLALGERDIVLYRTRRATLPDDELDGFPVETDLRRTLERKPAAVIIANPTALHLDVAIPAAEAGCHILLEKPISHSFERVDELKQALRRGGGKCLVGFQYRFHPTLRSVAEIVQGGEIGRALSFRAQYNEYLPACHPWEDYRQGYAARADLGGGAILTFCHPLDYLHWLLGDVDSLWAIVDRLSDLELSAEDTAEIGLRFVGGPIGSLHLGYNQQPPTHWLEIVGTQGALRWDNADGVLRWYHSADQAWRHINPPLGFERNALFLEEMKHFLSVIRGEAEPVCTLEDGEIALQLALDARLSSEQGKLIRYSV